MLVQNVCVLSQGVVCAMYVDIWCVVYGAVQRGMAACGVWCEINFGEPPAHINFFF
jgi:hypothetical protein